LSIAYTTSASVPSTEPQGDPERTPENGSVESGRAERGELDGVWRLPNGATYPRNIYNDLDSDLEDLPGYSDSGSSATSPSA
jgi:hypothetical protein